MAQARVGKGGVYERSSSVDLSSPPSEPDNVPSFLPTPPNHNAHPANGTNSTIRVGGHPGDFGDAASRFASATPQPAPAIGGASHTSSNAPAQSAIKEKKPRKRRVVDAEKKDAPPKKPRAAPGTTASRRKAKVDAPTAKVESSASPMPRQSTINDLLTPQENPPPPPSKLRDADESLANARSGFSMNSEAMQNAQPVYPQMQPPQPTFAAPQRTSGLNYDPVRSTTISAPSTPNLQSKPSIEPTPTRPVFGASASPAISTLTNPLPTSPQTTNSPFTTSDQTLRSPSQQHQFFLGLSTTPGATSAEAAINSASRYSEPPPKQAEDAAMDLDSTNLALSSQPTTLVKKGSSGTPSNAEKSPKPTRAKEAPPLPPTGSGLLSSAMFGGDIGKEANSASTDQAPNIILHVDLKGRNNVVINFARMAEEKYGFEALYPRLAKNRARLAKVAEAGDALEKAANGGKLGGTSAEESGDDDMSVDIDRDSDNDGDIAMSGLNGGTGANSETDGKGTKRKRRKKAEEYDQDGMSQRNASWGVFANRAFLDDFVDDSELAWEQQASVSKDGYFVYCGPLVPETKESATDRAGGESKRGRGRGRGGGPGSRGGRGGTAVGGDTGSGRGGGTVRGTTATRKPRVTKAGRANMDREKQEREKMAPLAAKPSGYPA